MWYMAWPKGNVTGKAPGRPMAYAESEDGINWTRPDLGLVEWGGNKHNNLCLIEPSRWFTDDYNCVIYDRDDPDPDRKYKIAFRSRAPASELRTFGADPRLITRGGAVMITATSLDGLRWKVVRPDDLPIKEVFECAGLYKFGGYYYVFGQQTPPRVWLADGTPCGRATSVFQSADFEHWTSAKSLGFVRPGYIPAPCSQGEEVHMAAGLWNRGNVLVGLYGMWHGAPPKGPFPHFHDVRIDLGLVVSNDGLHFREPVPDFAVVPHSESLEWDKIAIVQGHAFVNMARRTHIWYGQWDCTHKGYTEEIGLGTLRQDGFGHLSRMQPHLEGHFITCLLEADEPVHLFVNAGNVSQANPLLFELLDERNVPIQPYTASNCVPVVQSGVREPVRWKGGDAVKTSGGSAGKRFRIKVILSGSSGENQEVYAVYAAGTAAP